MRTTLIAALLIPGLAFAADPAECETPTKVSELQNQTLQTTLAFATLDVEGFAKAYGDSHALLDCVGERLSETSIVDFHRTEALGAFFEKDEERTRTAFQALLAVEPDWVLPEQLGAPGGALDLVLQKAKEKPPSLEVPLEASGGLTVLVDGKESTQRPANVPMVLQVLDPDGAVVWNSYVQAGEPLPDLTAMRGFDPNWKPGNEAPGEPDGPAAPGGDIAETLPPAHWRWGFDLGLTEGVRVERRLPVKGLAGYGLRVALTVFGDGALLFEPYVDLRLGGIWEIEGALVGGVGRTNSGTATGGGGAGLWLAVQPNEKLQIQAGFIGSSDVRFPDITIGWTF